MSRAKTLVAIGVLGALLGGIVMWRCSSETPVVRDAGAPVGKARARLRDLARRPPAALAGRVTAETKPVAAAVVCTQSVAMGDHREGEIRCVGTDADGRYAFAELRPGSYAVWASAAGFGAVRWHDAARRPHVTLATGESKAGIDLVLATTGVVVTGRVRDTRGRAVAGALVHVTVESEHTPSFTARTDDGGGFSARIHATGKVALLATADRHVDAALDAIVPASGLEIVMVPGATLSGTVVEGAQRTPVADARVDAFGGSATTDDNGRFTMTKLKPGRYKPTAIAIGRYGEAAESVLVRLGAAVDNVVIELHPVAVVAGRIAIDDNSGRGCPADQGQVNLVRRGSPSYYWGKTTGDGDVLLEGVVPGSYEVRVFCDGFVAQPPYADLLVGNSDVEEIVWKVAAGARVIGRVSAKGGGPIEEAIVVYAAGGAHRSGSVRTAADGTFTVDGLVPGTVTLQAGATDFTQSESVKVTAAIGTVPRAQLVLERGGSIVVSVTDAAGKPLHNAYVDVAQGGSGHTDLRGELTLSSMSPGAYDISVRTPWSERSEGPPKNAVRVTVAAGETARVKLTGATFAGKITGVVVDAAGAPISDVTVDVAPSEPEARRRDWQRGATWTRADGTFEIGGLPDRKLAVRARLEGADEAVVEGVSLGERVRITMKPTGSLGGTVVDPSGASVDDVVLQIEDRSQDIARSERLFHTRGKFMFRDLQAGTYRLTVDDDRQTSIVVTLADGQQRGDLVIRVRPRYSIRGRLVAADRTPLAGWNCELPHKEAADTTASGRTIMTWGVEHTITNARGEFLFEGIVGAEVTLSAGNRSRDPDASMIEVKTIKLGDSPIIDLGEVVVTPKEGAPAP